MTISSQRAAGITAARFCAGLAMVMSAGVAAAETFTVFNTGVDSNGVKLPLGSADAHWRVVTGAGVNGAVPAVVVSDQHPIGQYFTSPDALWVSLNASGSGAVNAPYTYRLTFDLTGYNPSSAVLSGSWGADNFGNVLLNGATPVGAGTFAVFDSDPANYNVPHPFSITSGFLAGLNTLDVQVVDTANPSGLNISGLIGTASLAVAPSVVPEPTTLMFAVFGLLGVYLFGRCRGGHAANA